VTSLWVSSEKVPKFIPVANEVVKRLARKMDGDASATIPEVVFNLSTTAHILGGCPMGRDQNDGVIDKHGRLFGYVNFYMADGSIIPVNLSINPA
jgi:cholesterol oxidase